MKKSLGKFYHYFEHWTRRHQFRHALDLAKTRLLIITAVFSFCLCIVSYRLFELTVLRQEGRTVAFNQISAYEKLTAGRADITDRSGKILATTLITSSIFANPKKVIDPKECAHKLAVAFPHLKESMLLQKLTSDKTFIWIQRHLSPKQQTQFLELGLAGIEFVRDHRRVYPQGHLASHVIGFTDIDNRGLAGIEKGMDERLKTCSDPLELSLDLRFQHIVRDELSKSIQEFKCTGAAAVILDLKSGEIIAMVSLPDFNPNKPLKFNEDERFNKTTLGIYEMGSILKIANTALGLESGAVKLGSRFDTTPAIKVGRFTITDYKVPAGVYNVAEIFIRSSNRGSIQIALAAGMDQQKAFFSKLGYFDTVKLEIPEIGQPSIPRHWRESTTITASYGYGFSISPLQVLVGVGTIVGGGHRLYPTLLKNGSFLKPQEHVVSPATSRKILQLMRLVVQQGTSRKAAMPGFFIAGKTGTANLLEKGGYNKQRVSTSFISVFGEQASNPRYAMIVRLYDPQRLASTHGYNSAGWNSVPTGRRIWERIAHITGMQPLDHLSKPLDPFFKTMDLKGS